MMSLSPIRRRPLRPYVLMAALDTTYEFRLDSWARKQRGAGAAQMTHANYRHFALTDKNDHENGARTVLAWWHLR